MSLGNDDTTFEDLCDLTTAQELPSPPKRTSIETVVYKRAGNLDILADIYLPQEVTTKRRPIALLIHGGGHCLYTRKDVNKHQIELLLARGLLPISIDYRLCPEITLAEGPMTDVRDALRWAREVLPSLKLKYSKVNIDGDILAAIGWSTGGTLAMSLGFTARPHGIKPPDVILTFYSPTNYDDDFFKTPNYPKIFAMTPNDTCDLFDAVRSEPIAAYSPSLTSPPDPRLLIIQHMNHSAQTLPILLNGLPSKPNAHLLDSLPLPSPHQIASINPYAQISLGNYTTPTFVCHGTEDDLVPGRQSVKTIQILRGKGVECGIGLAKGGPLV